MWKTCLITFIVYLWLSEYFATAHEVYMNLCFWHFSLLKQKLIRILLLKTMANEQISSIDWTKCFLCQSSKTKGLRCELQTHQKMASNLREFYELHELHYNLSWVGAFNDSKHFEQVLIKNKAQYHHTCTTNYNDSMLKRAWNRLEKHSNREEPAEVTSPPCKRRSEVLSYDFGKPVCCFCKEADEEINLCAAGTYHASKTKADALSRN